MKPISQDIENGKKNRRTITEGLNVEVADLVPVTASGARMQHNESELKAEELDLVIAPGLRMQHNETVISAEEL